MPPEPLVPRILAVWGGGGLILNFAWELAQRPLYSNYTASWEELMRCFIASLGDLVILAGLYGFMSLMTGSWNWFQHLSASRMALLAGAGLAVAVAIEWWALSIGRWSYSPQMPVVPGLELAWLPLLQMTLLPPSLALLSYRFRRE